MTIRFFKVIGTLALLGLGAMANAASLSLVPTAPVDGVNPGDIVSFDVVIDFTGDPALGGGYDIAFDESQLSYMGATLGVGDPGFSQLPEYTPGTGLLANAAAGDFAGLPEIATILSLQFEALAGTPVSVVALGPTSGSAGPWVSVITFGEYDPQPEYGSVTVTLAAVPVPAAAWLFGSALLGLVGVARRSRRA